MKKQIAKIALAAFMMASITASALAAEGKWEGVDTKVIEGAAKERGILKDTKEEPAGDLMLGAFMLAGATGGFMAGYYYRKLTEGGKKPDA